MASENDFFLCNDFSSDELLDWRIPDTWWSRVYEYPWAINYAKAGQVVADLGCGYHFRPFKDALSKVCYYVYAVDKDERVLDLDKQYPFATNLQMVVADMEKPMPIQKHSLDRIFCISVLEELDDPEAALSGMHRILKPDGLAVLTFDVVYNNNLPQGQYKGISVEYMLQLAVTANLFPREEISCSMDNRLKNDSLNLCVYHLVLKAAHEPQ